MSESHLDTSSNHPKANSQASSLQYPVRRMRNTAVLVKWIEEHQNNPYPTKAEKQYLAYYSGMNLTQLSTWFANARRRIKKIGMKTWLEGRSTFTVDFFPTSSLQPARPLTETQYGGSYTNPYAAYYPTQHSSTAVGLQSQRLTNGPVHPYASSDSSPLYQSASNSTSINGLYCQRSLSQPLVGMSAFTNWAATAMPSALTTIPTSSTVSLPQTRPGSNSGPLHSPLTAQAYTVDTLRAHSGQSALEVTDGTYTLPQPSPEHMLPECASTEPILQGSPKTHYQSQPE